MAMAIPIARMQGCGRFHVPGVREPVTGYHVRHALGLLDPRQRATVEGYLRTGCEGKPPPASTLDALREAVLETVRNAKRATPEGAARL
jgi:hypothetical protein